MKQTPIEWLEEQLKLHYGMKCELYEEFEQAKEMDKAERAKEYLRGFEDGKEYMKKIKTFKSE